MSFGIFGRKLGMTSFFNSTGKCIPVTAIFFLQNKICDFKFLSRDGYDAVVLSIGHSKQAKIKKVEDGLFKNVSINGVMRKEVRVDKLKKFSIGETFGVSLFSEGDFVTVNCVSKGKGFSGVIKRHNFSSQGASHGNSLSHRAPGSIGQCQSPGKVFKGKKMAGHLGNDKITIKNLKIINIYHDMNVILLKGSIPGSIGNKIILKKNTI